MSNICERRGVSPPVKFDDACEFVTGELTLRRSRTGELTLRRSPGAGFN